MADHSRSSEQQEADHAAASKGCGMFDFLKKKPEDAPLSSDNAGVIIKQEEKPERLHDSDISSSDEEVGENGEKKEKKKKKKKEKVKVCGHNKDQDGGDQCEAEEKKGIMEKMKEKLPEAKGGHDDDEAKKPEHEDGKEKGFMEKMKEKLPGGKPELETHQDKSKEKGFMEKIKEKLTKHDDNDEKKKET